MSRKLMLVFIAAIICILCAGAVSAADINETSMDIQTSQSDVLDDVSDTNLSNTYYENNDLSEEDLLMLLKILHFQPKTQMF